MEYLKRVLTVLGDRTKLIYTGLWDQWFRERAESDLAAMANSETIESYFDEVWQRHIHESQHLVEDEYGCDAH